MRNKIVTCNLGSERSGIGSRGQAALEFLITYGWAFFLVMIALAAFLGLGLFNFAKFLPDSCISAAGFTCIDMKAPVQGDNTITLLIRNELGQDIHLKSGSSTSGDGCVLGGLLASSDGAAYTALAGPADTFPFPNGATAYVKLLCSPIGTGRIRVDLSMAYTNDVSGVDHFNVVSIRTSVKQ